MSTYKPALFEKFWQKRWQAAGLYRVDLSDTKRKYYLLVELPYPSGDLHMGHWFTFAVTDILGRLKRMQGYNVFFPVGFDAFGLPAENAAIRRGINPREWTYGNIEAMKKQFETMGGMHDFEHGVITCDPEYYRWNQWIFLKMLEKGLAYRGKTLSNWCPNDKTVLANENVENGKCWRCGTEVVQKEVEQWFFKITEYAESLIWPEETTDKNQKAADHRPKTVDSIDWPQPVREGQNNWIGKSEGMEIEFPLEQKYNFVLLHGFTGGPDKNFFPWLKKTLEEKGYRIQVPALPNTDDADPNEQIKYVLANCDFDENTILLGHSLGTVVAMKVVEQLNSEISGLVLVAPFAKPVFKDHQRPFADKFDWKFDGEEINKNAGFVKVIADPDDSAVPLEQSEEVATMTGAEFIVVKAKEDHFTAIEELIVLKNILPNIRVFTKFPETIYGVTFMVIAPEHPLVNALLRHPEFSSGSHEMLKQVQHDNDQVGAVKAYVEAAKRKSELERTAQDKDKTGVFTGLYCINSVNGKKVPIWVADYVIGSYGTGAVMGVPGSDQRDFEFAVKYELPIIQVVASGDDDYHSYLMGADDISHEELKALGVKIVNTEKDGRRWLEFSKGKIANYEDLIEKKLTPGFWNEYIGRETVFIFKFKDGKIKRIVLTPETEQEIDKLAAEFNGQGWTKLRSVWAWLQENPFYKDKIVLEDGLIVNSGQFNGLKSQHPAKEKFMDYLVEEGIGQRKINYHLHDWSISRQRYWGTPIPVIHCLKCGIVPVPEKDLPVTLPEIKDYAPAGKPPLATAEDWVNVKCPKCGGDAKREVDTMDTFVDSSWYFLRYADPHNDKEIFDEKLVSEWLPAELYIGGAEHTLGHTLYSRYFVKFLHDIDKVPFDEYAKKRVHHGVILGPDGARMSKSKGNVVNPDEQVALFGADAVRMYLAFMGPYDLVAPWNPNGLRGVYHFLQRVWDLGEQVKVKGESEKLSAEDLYWMHKTIKKVGEDVNSIKYNTAVAALMEWMNYLGRKAHEGQSQSEKGKGGVTREEYETLLKLVAPFAPHMAEQLWQLLGNSKFEILNSKFVKEESIHVQPWPEYDEKYVKTLKDIIVLQVNGKVRDNIEVEPGAKQDEVEKLAKESEKVKKFLEGEPKKVIFVPGKLINFVV